LPGSAAQQLERVRRIGVLLNLAADDPMGQARVAAFVQGLQAAGWSDGRNVQIDTEPFRRLLCALFNSGLQTSACHRPGR